MHSVCNRTTRRDKVTKAATLITSGRQVNALQHPETNAISEETESIQSRRNHLWMRQSAANESTTQPTDQPNISATRPKRSHSKLTVQYGKKKKNCIALSNQTGHNVSSYSLDTHSSINSTRYRARTRMHAIVLESMCLEGLHDRGHETKACYNIIARSTPTSRDPLPSSGFAGYQPSQRTMMTSLSSGHARSAFLT